jgi:uncharacterized membrane protein YozB (DUF420 family)
MPHGLLHVLVSLFTTVPVPSYTMNHPLPALEARPAAVLAGILSHLLFFKRGERQLHPERYLLTFLLAFACSVLTLHHAEQLPLRAAFQTTATFAGLYLAGLYSSLIVYRLLFNPLNKFPARSGRASRLCTSHSACGTKKPSTWTCSVCTRNTVASFALAPMICPS